jgi:hypothetical protein
VQALLLPADLANLPRPVSAHRSRRHAPRANAVQALLLPAGLANLPRPVSAHRSRRHAPRTTPHALPATPCRPR